MSTRGKFIIWGVIVAMVALLLVMYTPVGSTFRYDAAGGFIQLVMGVILTAAMISVTFAPTIIAAVRRHRKIAWIAVINILFFWTIIGWIVPFIWSLTSNTDKPLKTFTNEQYKPIPDQGYRPPPV